jgi:hypothetical protein
VIPHLFYDGLLATTLGLTAADSLAALGRWLASTTTTVLEVLLGTHFLAEAVTLLATVTLGHVLESKTAQDGRIGLTDANGATALTWRRTWRHWTTTWATTGVAHLLDIFPHTTEATLRGLVWTGVLLTCLCVAGELLKLQLRVEALLTILALVVAAFVRVGDESLGFR